MVVAHLVNPHLKRKITPEKLYKAWTKGTGPGAAPPPELSADEKKVKFSQMMDKLNYQKRMKTIEARTGRKAVGEG